MGSPRCHHWRRTNGGDCRRSADCAVTAGYGAICDIAVRYYSDRSTRSILMVLLPSSIRARPTHGAERRKYMTAFDRSDEFDIANNVILELRSDRRHAHSDPGRARRTP